jgi:hypothetical protein
MELYAVAAVLEEAVSSITRYQRVQSLTLSLYQCLAGTCPGSPQQRLELGEGFFYEISMRKRILSRANVVASGNRLSQLPLALRSHPHCVWMSHKWHRTRCDPSGAVLPFEVRPSANQRRPYPLPKSPGTSVVSRLPPSPLSHPSVPASSPSRQVAIWRLIKEIHASKLSPRHNHRSPQNGPSVALDLPRAPKVPMSKYLCCRLYR